MRLQIIGGDGRSLARLSSLDDMARGFPTMREDRRETVLAVLNGDAGRIEMDGRTLTGVELVVMSERLKRAALGDDWTSSVVGEPPAAPSDQARWVLPRILPWGSVFQLTGPPKSGKSMVCWDLLAALTVPGRPFLGRFPASPGWHEALEGDDEMGVVTFIVSEKPAWLTEEGLRQMGADMRYIRVHYLRSERGGPGSFDLTNRAKFDDWLTRLHYCAECDGSDDLKPAAVVVDNVLPILRAVKKGPEASADWEAQFRLLLAGLDCENGGFLSHSYGGVARPLGEQDNWSQSDGLWSYMSDNPLDPASRRYFTIIPNYGTDAVPRTRVVLGDDGLLRLDGEPDPDGGTGSGQPDGSAPDGAAERESALTARLRGAPDGWLWTKDLCAPDKGPLCDYKANRSTADAMADGGALIKEEVQQGRSRGVRWRLA